MAGLVELQASFPRIPEPVRPLARIAVFFVPDKFFRPEPALLSQRQDQFQNKRVAFAVLRFFFDVENECAGGFEDAQKLFAARYEPFHIFIRRNPTVGVLALIGIRWRSDNQIKCIWGVIRQNIEAIAVFYF